MEKYEMLEEVGRGSFGVVWHAINLHTRQHVAIKKLKTKYSHHSPNKDFFMKEVKSLKKMNNHPYFVKLLEICKENDTVFLVFEYMQGSLYNRMVITRLQKQSFSETEIRNLCFQVFQGLAYMHNNGYFHRDLKPENLLVLHDMIKIGDLGSARETNDQSPYTHNVTTLWYRAPEVFLRSPCYDSAVDMWAMGAIMAELFNFRPLFQGDSEAVVISKMCEVLGAPTESSWSAGLDLARNMCFEFPEFPGVRFCDMLPSWASLDAVNLIASLLSWNPSSRPTAMEVLQHPFFYDCYMHVPPTSCFEDDTSYTIMMEARMQRIYEFLMDESPRSTLESCTNCSERAGDQNEDEIRMLPENPFDFMK